MSSLLLLESSPHHLSGMSRGRSLKPLLTLSTETLTYPDGIIAPWILGVLVGSGGEKHREPP